MNRGKGRTGRRSRARCLRRGDVVLVEPGDFIPGDGEVIEGVGLGGRKRHHGRIRAGDPRVRRRLQFRHGRNAPAVRLAGGAHHVQSGRDFSRPHDHDGRSCTASEDAERNRADHPAGGAHAGVSARHRRPSAVLAVQRRCDEGRAAGYHHHPRGAAGVSDPHHDRRACSRRSASPVSAG